MRRLVLCATAGLLVCCLAIPAPAFAQPCPGIPSSGPNIARVYTKVTSSPTRPLSNFIGAGCATQLLGAATQCLAQIATLQARLRARWPSAQARLDDSTGGCRFVCPGGTCVVRNDGLPVELLSFGVE